MNDAVCKGGYHLANDLQKMVNVLNTIKYNYGETRDSVVKKFIYEYTQMMKCTLCVEAAKTITDTEKRDVRVTRCIEKYLL